MFIENLEKSSVIKTDRDDLCKIAMPMTFIRTSNICSLDGGACVLVGSGS